MKAIITAIDFSKSTDLIVAEAAKLARGLKGKVVLVTVLFEPVFVPEYAPPQKRLARIAVGHERAARHRLEKIQRRLQSDFVPTEIVVRRGNAAAQIVDQADEHDAAFIVMGSHGHTAFYELVLGGTTQQVLRQTRRPVVIITPKTRKPRRAHWRLLSMPFAD